MRLALALLLYRAGRLVGLLLRPLLRRALLPPPSREAAPAPSAGRVVVDPDAAALAGLLSSYFAAEEDPLRAARERRVRELLARIEGQRS